MTAHRAKPTLTAERVAWFIHYRRKYPGWGVFHVVLSDGNWKLPIDPSSTAVTGEPGEADAIAWFNDLTTSQRRRLGMRVAREDI